MKCVYCSQRKRQFIFSFSFLLLSFSKDYGSGYASYRTRKQVRSFLLSQTEFFIRKVPTRTLRISREELEFSRITRFAFLFFFDSCSFHRIDLNRTSRVIFNSFEKIRSNRTNRATSLTVDEPLSIFSFYLPSSTLEVSRHTRIQLENDNRGR